MEQSLSTTNLFLGIIAVVSLIEGLIIVGGAIYGFVLYGRMAKLVDDMERRHVDPMMARVNTVLDEAHAVLGNLKHVSATVKDETDRVDQAVHRTMERVDGTVRGVKSNVRARTSWLVGAFKGARVALEHVLQS